ncbi:ABC transporter permease [Marinibaculum pumilum]|uniref:ABC transporter permease n=1 Tax=Marinibaculum pumilum TaxID=1766165 RepID=A0ABV7KTJ0_9PROT
MTATMRRLLTGQNSRQGLWLIPLLIGGIACILLALRSEEFLNAQNLLNLVAQAVPLLVIAIGQMLVILVRGLDLSVGAVVSLTTAILALDAPGYVVLPAAFLAAALVGAVNGIAVTRLHVHPIIATLSMMMIVQGGTMLLRPVAGGTIPAIVTDLVTGEVLGIYMPLVWAVLVLLLGWKLIHGSRFGLHLFAIGGGPEIARAFGIADRRNVLLAYIACSLFAALAGCFLAGRIASGDPNIGTPFALDSITAVALGGTQLAGGVGSLQGTVTGALIMALLANGMNLENLSAFIQTAVKGAILLVVVALQPRRFMGL